MPSVCSVPQGCVATLCSVRLLCAVLTRLSCPPVCPCPLRSGSVLPAVGGPLGSVNGFHTCKGESALLAASPSALSVHFHP